MSVAVDVLSAVLLLGASAFVLLGAAGLHRFDDAFSRLHAATKAITFGVVLAAAGAALQLDDPADIFKLALAVVLQLVTAPVASQLIARAAYRAGTELSPDTVLDELAARTTASGGPNAPDGIDGPRR